VESPGDQAEHGSANEDEEMGRNRPLQKSHHVVTKRQKHVNAHRLKPVNDYPDPERLKINLHGIDRGSLKKVYSVRNARGGSNRSKGDVIRVGRADDQDSANLFENAFSAGEEGSREERGIYSPSEKFAKRQFK